MRWLREAGWLVALCLAAYLLTSGLPKRKQLPDPQESREAFEKLRAEFEQKLAKRAEQLARVQEEGTLDLLRTVGRAYARHTTHAKTPPREEDFREVLEVWHSRRDQRPFVIQWGVDLTRLPDSGSNTLLAWEQTADDMGRRCVLMADGKTTKVVTAEEFERLPRAK